MDLSIRYGYSYWDSLILATAVDNGCSILYTGDMQDGQVIDDKLRIVNPFAAKKTVKGQN
jgi:predicted nucleic acid-binding protein